MSRRISQGLAVAVVIAGITAAAIAQIETKYRGLPNFHKVNQNLYRSAQPDSEGMQRLRQIGIKTIINLRDDDERARSEGTAAAAAGLRYFNVPMDTFGRPSDDKVERILAIIETAENQPVLVHCRRGADRTGTIIAIYRVLHDGWTSEKAKAEANRYGMMFWQVGMKDYIHDYARRHSEKAVPAKP